MTRSMRAVFVHAFRRAALPLAWYYAVTIVLPFANGAVRTGGPFVSHALVVLVVPPILIVLACAIRTVAQIFASGWRLAVLHIIARTPERDSSRPPWSRPLLALNRDDKRKRIV